jgi:hypothetical protein
MTAARVMADTSASGAAHANEAGVDGPSRDRVVADERVGVDDLGADGSEVLDEPVARIVGEHRCGWRGAPRRRARGPRCKSLLV